LIFLSFLSVISSITAGTSKIPWFCQDKTPLQLLEVLFGATPVWFKTKNGVTKIKIAVLLACSTMVAKLV
jgi:hypothetical protein